jgi:hypothetical protein
MNKKTSPTIKGLNRGWKKQAQLTKQLDCGWIKKKPSPTK